MKREDIIVRARSFIGVPWVHQGRDWTQGVDCVGLPIMVGASLGLDFTALPTNYPRRPDGTFLRYFKEQMVIRNLLEHEDGDVIVFSMSGYPCHCGIRSTLRGKPALIHAHASYRKVVEQTLESAVSVLGKPGYVFSYSGVED